MKNILEDIDIIVLEADTFSSPMWSLPYKPAFIIPRGKF